MIVDCVLLKYSACCAAEGQQGSAGSSGQVCAGCLSTAGQACQAGQHPAKGYPTEQQHYSGKNNLGLAA